MHFEDCPGQSFLVFSGFPPTESGDRLQILWLNICAMTIFSWQMHRNANMDVNNLVLKW